MRWDRLFADLEASLDGVDRRGWDAEIAERERDERARVGLASRLLAREGASVRAVLVDGATVAGTVADAAGAWVLLEDPRGQVLVPLDAIAMIEGVGTAVAHLTEVRRRMGVGTVLRELAATGDPVAVDTSAGRWAGRIAAVGADHLDLVADRTVRTVPLASLLAVRPA
ncbi:hypothetical protein [Demequina gelatinilytica]|uniref:hypothetical protein n=1 Tax=Demequina gelatinilytica TaxID=1638980 RepID=UPI0007813B7D|nr:hypothetical protein [Demequina gelatinilytica]